jgi:hypothetical protein
MQIYLLDIHVFYTVMSAIYGFLLGARDRLGEVASLNFSFELLSIPEVVFLLICQPYHFIFLL